MTKAASLPRRLRKAAEEEASKLGASVTFGNASKHSTLTVAFNGQERTAHHSRGGTAKRRIENQEDWVRQYVRRIVKELSV